MGVTHRQRELRDRTIDAEPGEPIAEPFMVLARHIERLEARLTRLEGLVTQLSGEALRNAVTEAVTRDASPVTPITPDRNDVTEPVTARNAYRNAERQRRYRERKKAST